MDRLLEAVGQNPRNVRFSDLRRLCDRYVGKPRQRGSHLFYRMPWDGQPLVNLQARRGMAEEYQVRQVINAIDKLEETNG